MDIPKTARDYKFLRFTRCGPVATLVISRPAVLNALNNQLIEEMLDALESLDGTTRLLVLRGDGNRAFAAGADIGELTARTMWTELDNGSRRLLTRKLETFPFPTLAAIDGLALGGGLELALACHFRFASDSAKFGLPEARLGLMPGNGGTVRLTRLVGSARALGMMLLSEQIDAAEAARIGLVNWVVPAAEFENRLVSLSERFVELPRLATRAILDCVTRGMDMSGEQAIEYEHRWFQICLAGSDRTEGIEAFLQKRVPAFSGAHDEPNYKGSDKCVEQ